MIPDKIKEREKYGNKRFVENLGEYEYDVDNSGLTKAKKKRVALLLFLKPTPKNGS